MSSESPESASPQTESSFLNNHEASDLTGAITMVPPEEFDDTLNERELKMRFGEPVIFGGTNFTELSTRYQQSLCIVPKDEAFHEWNVQPLQEFSSNAESAEMHYSHRVLVLCDSLKMRGIIGKDAHEILKENHGYGWCERTLRRQCAHARLALILAAAGKIDLLPSQNVCAAISSVLPRHAWVLFLSAHPVKESSPEAVKKKIVDFAGRRGITLRGRPVRRLESAACTPLLLAEAHETSPISPEARQKIEEGAPSTVPTLKRLAAKKLSKLLAAELHKSVPAYHLQDSEVFAKVFAQELDLKVSSVPRPARHAKLDALAATLCSLDPVRTQSIQQAALRLLLGQVVDRATDLAGANATKTKKMASDTPCPESPETTQVFAQPREEPFL